MNKKLLLTANIHAGKGEVRNYLPDMIDYFTALGWDVTCRPSQRRRDLPGYIRENAGDYQLLVSCGGDGTLNETITGLIQCGSPPPLAYLPAGTVNDFASSLKIPKDMELSAQLVDSGVPFRCDIGRFNIKPEADTGSEFFSYVAAFGAFTDVAYQTPQPIKQVLGRMAYILEGVKRLANLKTYHMKIEAEDFSLEDDFIYGMVCNTTSVGGFRFHEKFGIAMDDGVFETVLIRYPRTSAERQGIINALVKQEAVEGLVYLLREKKLTITAAEPAPWTLDGEFGGNVGYVEIENLHRALNILVPAPEEE